MAAPSLRRIAVGVDGSDHAKIALDWAIDLARKYGCELTIVAVAPLIPIYLAPNEPFVPVGVPLTQIGHYREITDAAVAAAKAAGVTSVTAVAYEGVVVDELLRHLEEHPTDLLVLGSRGLSTARRILLGSVSTAVVTHAPCPVLIVRPTLTKPGG